MSTRCQIVTLDGPKVYPVKIYKHCDGYPEGVLPILEPFTRDFAANRGEDPEYLMAQILRRFAREQDGQDFTGWGVSTFWHGDIAWLYIVLPQGTVTYGRPRFIGSCADDHLPELEPLAQEDRS